MIVEINELIEDSDIFQYVLENEQAEVLESIFNECTEFSQLRFIGKLDDSYFVEELERRGYTITKNK
jgi:hypothetical protein|nr:MAG TPA_asm: hypothetical protein [Caudoviricetes sp.]